MSKKYRIPLMKSTFSHERRTKDALADFILNADRLSIGEKCQEFERQFAQYQGRKTCILFNSGASANLAILQALKNMGRLKEGDRIGFSALTWSTNVMPIIQMGLIPVPVDCNPSTLNVMSANLEERLKEVDLKAFFITNALGFTGDLSRIKDMCEDRGIIFFEDNCEALGTILPENKAGNFGLCSSFSFFVGHHMSTIEGGMVATDDDELFQMIKIVRSNGWDRNLTADEQQKWRQEHNIDSEFRANYAFYDLGFNVRPTEITGMLGLLQLPFLEENCRIRESNYRRFEEAILINGEIWPINHSHIRLLSSFATPIICDNLKTKQKYMKRFCDAGIEIRPIISGNIQNQPFYKKYVKATYPLPGADFIDKFGFYFGNHPELSENDIAYIEECLLDGIAERKDLFNRGLWPSGKRTPKSIS